MSLVKANGGHFFLLILGLILLGFFFFFFKGKRTFEEFSLHQGAAACFLEIMQNKYWCVEWKWTVLTSKECYFHSKYNLLSVVFTRLTFSAHASSYQFLFLSGPEWLPRSECCMWGSTRWKTRGCWHLRFAQQLQEAEEAPKGKRCTQRSYPGDSQKNLQRLVITEKSGRGMKIRGKREFLILECELFPVNVKFAHL